MASPEVYADRQVVGRILKGLLVGFGLAFGIACAILCYAVFFDMQDLIQVTGNRLTQLGLVLMLNLIALFVGD